MKVMTKAVKVNENLFDKYFFTILLHLDSRTNLCHNL